MVILTHFEAKNNDYSFNFLYNKTSYTIDMHLISIYNVICYRGVAQMGARVLWEHEVAGSSPVTPTILNIMRV